MPGVEADGSGGALAMTDGISVAAIGSCRVMSSDSRPSLEYRPFLDGLRALAVILVFVFHAAGPALPGGFIGVDVFFVLSGYLITRVILTQMDARPGFGFADFYARRARRLLPAMFLLVAAVAVREAVWGSILDAATRAREIVATLLYVSNWNFIIQADDYFAAAGEASPLRHTWSLAVEEQFYIVFPVLIVGAVLVARQRRWFPLFVLTTLATVSFVLMVALFEPGNVVRVYFGTDTRAFQLLIGAAAGYVLHVSGINAARLAAPLRSMLGWAALASLGLLVVLAATMSGRSEVYFRGGALIVAIAAIIVVVGTDLSPSSLASRVLSWRPAVLLGVVSYGFYLWHWPIILWVSAPEGASFLERRVVNGAQFALTVLISVGSYYLLEQPIRQRRGAFGVLSPRWSVALGLAASVFLAVALGNAVAPQAAPVAASPSEVELLFTSEPEMSDRTPLLDQRDQSNEPGPVGGGEESTEALDLEQVAVAALADKSYEACPENPRPCVKYEPDADPDTPTVVLLGDSTAQAYDPALKLLAERYEFRYVQAAVGGCPISHRLLATGVDGELHKESNFMCFEQIPLIYEEVEERWDPDLYIATSWNETNSHVEGDVLVESGTPEHYVAVQEALDDVVSSLIDGSRFAFIHVLPPGPSVECLETDGPTEPRCQRPVTPDSGEKGYNAIFDLLAAESPEVVSVRLDDVVCADAVCPLMMDGIVIRYDGGHLTATASRALGPVIADRLRLVGIDLADLG